MTSVNISVMSVVDHLNAGTPFKLLYSSFHKDVEEKTKGNLIDVNQWKQMSKERYRIDIRSCSQSFEKDFSYLSFIKTETLGGYQRQCLRKYKTLEDLNIS